MIEIRDSAPMFVCDRCQKVIRRDGVFLFSPVLPRRLFFAHGGECQEAMRRHTAAQAWRSLRHFMASLETGYDGSVDREPPPPEPETPPQRRVPVSRG